MNYLSKVLATEYAAHNIVVQTVTPNQVNTTLAKELYNPSLAVRPAEFVRHALQTVGSEQQTSAHPKHKFINNLFAVVEYILGDAVFMRFKYSSIKRMRQDLLKKKAK